jgi:ADP-ribosylglycohydrolase
MGNDSNKVKKKNIISKEMNYQDKQLLDKIEGALYGAFIGDSIGSAVEFKESLTDKEIKDAMEMNGSQIFQTGPGQITDDSELSLALGQALDSDSLDLDRIADWYGKWAKSNPFDIGITTGYSMKKVMSGHISGKSKIMIKAAIDKNDSCSNGSLMKVMPLCIWCRNLSNDDLWRAIQSECSLTHSNIFNHYVNYAYAFLVKLILKNDDLQKSGLIDQLYKEISLHSNDNLREHILELIDFSKREDPFKDLKQYGMGFVKIAFCLSINIFRMDNLDYKESIKKIISNGGDTDTNAAILGGLLGCYYGKKVLIDSFNGYIEKIDSFDSKNCGIKRPKDFTPKYKLGIVIYNVFQYAPKELNIIPDPKY